MGSTPERGETRKARLDAKRESPAAKAATPIRKKNTEAAGITPPRAVSSRVVDN